MPPSQVNSTVYQGKQMYMLYFLSLN